MTLPAAVADAIRPHVGAVRSAEPVGGGCIVHATRVEAGGATYFLKWSEDEAGRTFEAEAAGLRALRDAARNEAGSPLLVPEVLAAENAVHLRPGFLLMAWIEPGRKDAGFWQRFGEGLAALHRHTAPNGRYGFGRDNFIGRLRQPNAWHDRWPDFFGSRRLEPQIEMAREQARWNAAWSRPADRLLGRLGDLLPAAPPASVLHGDLWSGNVLAASEPVPAPAGSRAALIDPAVYVGHRETDLALTELFGGFGRPFYDAYRTAWPLEPGYEERRAVYNLYHLLNHLNHFGAGYAAGVERTLRRFS